MADELARRRAARPVHVVSADEAGAEEKIRAEYLAQVRAAARTRDYLLGRTAAAYAELVSNICLNYQASVRRAQDRRATQLAALDGQPE